MKAQPYLQDIRDGFLHTVDIFSDFKWHLYSEAPGGWDDFRKFTSPGIRALQSYSLRKGETPLSDVSESEVPFNVPFYVGRAFGAVVAIGTFGLASRGLAAWAKVERKDEPKIKRYYQRLGGRVDF